MVNAENVVNEVTLLTGAYSAEYHGTYVMSMTTKSGTNQFHGSAYWYHKNRSLNAKPWGASSGGTYWRSNNPGFTIGGPIIKDRTHFFFNYERSKYNQPTPQFLTVPTAERRAGDFSKTCDADGNLVTIYDPLTARRDPNDPT